MIAMKKRREKERRFHFNINSAFVIEAILIAAIVAVIVLFFRLK